MSDSTTTVEELRQIIRQFVEERDWRQFHAPKNVAMALANELGIDVSDAIRNKMVKNRLKYPADEFHGRYRRDG